MRTRLLAWWDAIRSSYWFVPALMTITGVALALGMTRLDRAFGDEHQHYEWFASTPEGARSMLSALAGAQVTLAGLTFSITIVALTVASQQFGPRILRNFMRDLINQIVLGTFVATFVYCILVQGQIRGGEETTWVPWLALTLAVGLAIVSVGVLIFFIHHVSTSIHASEVIGVVGREIDGTIDALFPEPLEADAGAQRLGVEDVEALLPESDGAEVAARAVGYVQVIDFEGLLSLARARELLIRLECRPGDHVVRGCAIATVWPRSDDEAARRINDSLIVDSQRTPVQDLEFSIDQLVEVAVRALSPGINDPFTAMTCVDRLTASLCTLAERRIPAPVRRDEDGVVRVIDRPWSFRGALDAAFDQIRQNARGTASVSLRILENLALLAGRVSREEDREAVRRQAEMIGRGASALEEELDRSALEERLEIVRRSLAEREAEVCAGGSARARA